MCDTVNGKCCECVLNCSVIAINLHVFARVCPPTVAAIVSAHQPRPHPRIRSICPHGACAGSCTSLLEPARRHRTRGEVLQQLVLLRHRTPLRDCSCNLSQTISSTDQYDGQTASAPSWNLASDPATAATTPPLAQSTSGDCCCGCCGGGGQADDGSHVGHLAVPQLLSPLSALPDHIGRPSVLPCHDPDVSCFEILRLCRCWRLHQGLLSLPPSLGLTRSPSPACRSCLACCCLVLLLPLPCLLPPPPQICSTGRSSAWRGTAGQVVEAFPLESYESVILLRPPLSRCFNRDEEGGAAK